MTKPQKSTTLYPHPFSRAYWHDAAQELKDTRMLVFAALMIALRVALKMVYIPLAPNLKINTAFLANALGAMVIGPVLAGLCAVVTDFLGYLMNPEVVYFIPFILTEVAGSVIFGMFLYRAKVTPVRVMLSRFCICTFVNVILQTPLMIWYYALYMGGKVYALTIPSIIKNLFMFPIESVVLTLFLSVIVPITNRMGLTFTGTDAKDCLKFSKKQLSLLAILMVFGTGCVFGYLSYYYQTTSLSSAYSAQERYAENTKMIDIVKDYTDDYDDDTLVTTVESAYKKFLGEEITYTVAVYTVDEAALEGYSKDLETIRGMSKSKAKSVAGDGVMTGVGTAQVVINEKTGEIISFQMK